MSDRLSAILENKRVEIDSAKQKVPLSELKSKIHDLAPMRNFISSLRLPGTSLIAEIKKASPSKGVIASEFDHRRLASAFESGGARALSVLTDQMYFQGRPEFMWDIKGVSLLPVLRKDFILDEYQVYESRVLGADAILLIVRAISGETIRRLLDCAKELGLAVLVEVHDIREVEVANRLHPEMIGVNNRDLSDFSVSIDRSLALRPRIDEGCLTVSESGIQTRNDIVRLQSAGFDAFLVGETLVASKDWIGTLRELVGV